MLPIHVESERPTFAASPSFSEYMRRMIQYAQMDISYTFAQMIDLIKAPRKVYQLTSYRKQTKHQWARDDPAFIVVLVFFLTVASIAYGVALRVQGLALLRILGLFIGLHFLLEGAIVATFLWYVSNKYLRVQPFHGVEQRMEWMCAFDIHCNSFFPLFLFLYVVHYFFLPFLIQPTLAAAVGSNLLYAVALCYYSYITSLGYSTLPFLERTEIFLYPSIPVLITVVVLSLLRINLTRLSISTLGV
mmetsp:Transcript_30292/g.85438  ORF Transcript_30292/g.85438 Transcript_30292/m.85438 type:complete len:246 (+) Transcript_30292:58-795(+)